MAENIKCNVEGEKMRKLQKIGFWNGMSDMGYIWPQEIVAKKKIEPKLKCAIISYLQHGVPVEGYMGDSSCRFCGKILGSHDMSDGTWVWPEKLEHYIEEHNVMLPEEFIAHAEKKKWHITFKYEIPDRDIEVNFKSSKWSKTISDYYVETFWISWCARNRCPAKRLDNIEPVAPPTSSGVGMLTSSILSDMFSSIECMDIVVDEIQVDKIARLDKVKDDLLEKRDDGYYQLWSAKIIPKKSLIVAMNTTHALRKDEDINCMNDVDNFYLAKVALRFVNKKPVFYFSFKEAVIIQRMSGKQAFWSPKLADEKLQLL